ncbi:MAG: hypothetical protein Q9P44_09385 [Anaerolineae bacterium]|nr:hypothetical protein [Anaerolineae bacterium]
MSQLQMMRNLQFTTEDLRSNRDGRISDLQRERFTPPPPNKFVVAVLLGHLIAIGALLALLAVMTKSSALWLIMGVVVLMMFAPFGVMQQKNQQRPIVRDDIAKGKVEQVCGIAVLTEKKRRKTYFELTIAGVTMEISPTEASAFINQRTYCVYYLPGSKTLLAAEPVD